MKKGIVVFVILCGFLPLPTRAEDPHPAIFAEIFLAQEKKADMDTIRQAFAGYSIARVHPQFFRTGHPPQNIAIGSEIPAVVARLVIDIAVQYNRGVTHLLPQFRFFPHQIAIGSSAFNEKVPVPIRPEDLKRLRDPHLSDRAFHALYRTLTGEKQKTYEGIGNSR